MGGEKSLEINLISAKDLMNVERLSGMNVYADVSLMEGPTKKKLKKVKTQVHLEGGVNPIRNFPVELRVDECLVEQNALYVAFELKSCPSDGVIGEVIVPVKGLLDHYYYYKFKAAADHDKPRVLGYQVITPSGNPQGKLYFSYRVTGYPDGLRSFASPPSYNYPYPPPSTGYPSYNYPYPPPSTGNPSYNYPYPPPYYVYAPPRPPLPPHQLPHYAAQLGTTVLGAIFSAWLDDAGFGDAVSSNDNNAWF